MRKQTIVIIISRLSQKLFRIQVTNTTIGETGSIKIRALGLKAACDIAFAIGDGYTFYPHYDVAVGSKNLEIDAYIQERLKSHNAQCKKEAAANANSNRPQI